MSNPDPLFELPTTRPHPAWRTWLPSRGNVLFVSIVAVVLLLYVQTAGAVPARESTAASTSLIPYQGRLVDSGGVPLDGSFAVTFKLYSLASGGSALWTEAWSGGSAVSVTDGLFNVMLGSLTPIPPTVFSANSSLWLGIKVGTDSEMAPRVQLGSAPFAMRAQMVPAGSITTTMIADGAVSLSKIANDASEPNRIQVWSTASEFSFDATGGGANHLIDTEMTLTVPTGKAYYYLVILNASLNYLYAERTGALTSFYAFWTAAVTDDITPISEANVVAYTGTRFDWAALGNSTSWNTPINTSWVVRLTQGAHTLKIRIGGYSDNTMDFVRVASPILQVMRIP